MPGRLESICDVISPTGRGVERPEGEYDIVFDLSGTESGLQLACDRVSGGGKLCSMSHIDGAIAGPYLLRVLTPRDVTFTVSYLNGERETLRSAATMLAEGWSDAWDGLVEIFPLDELQQAFDRRRASPRCKTMIAVSA
jgi:threonine dehydrogenase-like Zn-dependent dehydrogenase